MQAQRDTTLDIAKAIAIVAIVAGHVWRGLNGAGIIHSTQLFALVDTTIYMWHLTVFAFTAGLFVQRGMRRDGPWQYARDRNANFLWLYLLWSLIQGIVKLAAASLVNSPTSAWGIFQIWYPEGQLWFFGWIGVMMVFTASAQPWVSAGRKFVVVVASAAGSLAMWGIQGDYLGTQGLALTIYFITAVLWGGDGLLRRLRAITHILLLPIGTVAGLGMIGLALAGVATPPTTGGDGRTSTSVALGVIATTLGLICVLSVSRVLAESRLGPRLARLGEQSMTIFVAHIIFGAGARIVLAKFGIDSLGIHLIVGVVAGVAGPLALQWATRHAHARWIFESPRWISRRPASCDAVTPPELTPAHAPE